MEFLESVLKVYSHNSPEVNQNITVLINFMLELLTSNARKWQKKLPHSFEGDQNTFLNFLKGLYCLREWSHMDGLNDLGHLSKIDPKGEYLMAFWIKMNSRWWVSSIFFDSQPFINKYLCSDQLMSSVKCKI